ncbi:MAG TPA: SDR family oxidoreductase [Candidatus Acidoferrales bacterium]|nr:SDR family oxidoreductase [Candidatus Acidoferrales bacterium]
MMEGFHGKTALVTGGSVGTSVAESFLKSGASVAFVYRNSARLASLNERFTEFRHLFLPIGGDLSDFNCAVEIVEQTKKRFGRVDFLINSLGGWTGGKKLHEHSATELHQMFSVDVVPTFNIMAAVLPVMMEHKFGKIVNFVSMQVFGTGAGNAIYSASKSAVLALTKAAAEEYKDFGVSVYAVAPSVIDTESNRKSMTKADVNKWVKIEEIVDAIFFLCGAGDSSNGTIIKFPGKL